MLEEEFNTNPHVNPGELLTPFLISSERTLNGSVLSNLDSTRKSVNLLTVYQLSGDFIYQFFGETKPHECKKIPPFIRYNALFFVYKFLDDNTNEELILLSDKQLELTTCKLTGMEATCYDFIKVGNMAKISSTTKVIFVTKQQPEIEKITEKQFWKLAKEYGGEERMHEAFFGKYPHPPWFSMMLMAWMCSGKLDNMPTHLSLLSPPSSGKTKLLKGLSKVFKQEIIGGGTIKGLVPSFANGMPREGYLIRAKRFGLVDEFIHIIQYTGRSAGSDFDGGSYQLLKVLEHAEDDYSSAFGTIRAKPKMWTLFVSNIKPHEHIRNLVDLHVKLNAAFMSRLLWYVYDEQHINFINTAKKDVMKYGAEAEPVFSPQLLSMIDYLHSFIIDIPVKDIEDIRAKYQEYVPSSLLGDIYDSRMVMHIYRMLDGYVKLQAIIEQRGNFKVEPRDIAAVDELFGRIVRSWSYGLKESELPPRMKINYLNPALREVYDFIEMNPGCDPYRLDACGSASGREIAELLVGKGLVRKVSGLGGMNNYYTHNANIE